MSSSWMESSLFRPDTNPNQHSGLERQSSFASDIMICNGAFVEEYLDGDQKQQSDEADDMLKWMMDNANNNYNLDSHPIEDEEVHQYSAMYETSSQEEEEEDDPDDAMMNWVNNSDFNNHESYFRMDDMSGSTESVHNYNDKEEPAVVTPPRRYTRYDDTAVPQEAPRSSQWDNRGYMESQLGYDVSEDTKQLASNVHFRYHNTRPLLDDEISSVVKEEDPALYRSDTEETASTETCTSEGASFSKESRQQTENNVGDDLERYTEMIQARQPGLQLDDIRNEMLNDQNLTKREVLAFFQGLRLNWKVQQPSPPPPPPPQPTPSATPSTPASPPPQEPIEDSRSDVVPVRQDTDSSSKPKLNGSNKWLRSSPSRKSTRYDRHKSMMMSVRLMMQQRQGEQSEACHAEDDNYTVASVMSTMSCRELSIQRLQRRIASNRNRANKTNGEGTPEEPQKEKQPTEKIQKLLEELQQAETRQKKLEQQLQQAGVQVAEDIPYEQAKQEVERIAQRMQEIGDSNVTHADPNEQKRLREEYFVLEQEMEKYMTALMLTDEYIEEQQSVERAFDDAQREKNRQALSAVWNHMPVDFVRKSVKEWQETPSPSGHCVPKAFLQKFSRTNVLSLVRMPPTLVARAHASTLENRRVTGLTLTERRGLICYLQPIAEEHWRKGGNDAMVQRKWTWYNMMRNNFKEKLLAYERHVQQYPSTTPNSCPCNMVGKQCPVRANNSLNYFAKDYGHPSDVDHPKYETCDLKEKPAKNDENGNDSGNASVNEEAAAAAAERAHERRARLKKHYGAGKLLQVSLASGSCSAMEEWMDRLEQQHDDWLLQEKYPRHKPNLSYQDALIDMKRAMIPLLERLKATKDESTKQDSRSILEVGLCEDLYEVAKEMLCFIERKHGCDVPLPQLRQLWKDIHNRNLTTVATNFADQYRPACSRPSRIERNKKIEAKCVELEKEDEVRRAMESAAAAAHKANRGIQVPNDDGNDDGNPRVGLLAAINARKKRVSPGAEGQSDDLRAGLLAAINSQKGKSKAENKKDDVRGSLLAAINASKSKKAQSTPSNPKANLLAAINSRKAGGNEPDARGSLMAAIAARNNSVKT